MRRALPLLLACLAACGSRRASPPSPTPRDASADLPATRVCYGAAGSAVEVPRGTDCATLGASATPPAGVAPPPPARRTRVAADAGILF